MSDERHVVSRAITFLPLLILDSKGEVIDSTATAHDLTPRGFKGECQADIKEGETFFFAFELPDGGPPARGQATAVWVKKHDFAIWVGGKITRMSWGDKRRFKAAIAPPGIDWSPIIDYAFKALVLITVLMALQRIVFGHSLWRRALLDLIPTFLALMVMGWALVGLLRRR